MAVEKCPRSLNLSKIWPRYGQNKISYETVKIWKIHWKLKYSESRYCFANISATKARIFMKFYVVVHFYLMSLSFKFHKDLRFCYGDICKIILTFLKIYFQCTVCLQKIGTVFILQISRQTCIEFSNRFFLLKTKIHMQILNAKPFLYNFRGLRKELIRFPEFLSFLNSTLLKS